MLKVFNQKLKGQNLCVVLVAFITFMVSLLLPAGLIGMWIYALNGGDDVPLMERYLSMVGAGLLGTSICWFVIKKAKFFIEE